MAPTFSCSQGHRWEAPAASIDAASLFCPVCGAAPSLPFASTAADAAPTPPAASACPGVLAVPGYEILGELGRGGMGVVYKARHLKLNRLVALKMLTAGAHAGSDLLQRFQREAESLARLTHPNIVQIHEVGWIEPHGPYLTLEYVEGGSLSRKLARTPQPPRQAAEVVAVLARAVHFAHKRGVLHRDLKPANVLLTPDGTPKVTDFGLARFLQAEAASAAEAPTPTGAVLGTPSYMAPEQASGVVRAPTAALDVYALGAVLYEMLTGRPPFLAEGSLETILLVMTEDPVPPRRLQSKVPRDLETICLHCLRKTPRQRYPSAAALADDLQRFLDGKPIQVRPAGVGERAVKWARRRPAAAALLGMSVLAVFAGLGAWGWFQYQLYEKNANLTKANADLESEKDLYNNLLVASVDTVSDYGDAVDDAVAPLAGGEQARRALLERRLEFFAPFLTLAPDNPKLQQRKGRGLFEAAKIHQKLGDLLKAEQEYNDAIDLYERAMGASSETPALRHELGRTHVQLGILLSDLRHRDEAEREYNLGVGLLQHLVDDGQTDAAVRRNLAAAYHDLATLETEEKHWPEALAAFNKAVDLCKALVAEDDKEDRYKVLLAENYADCGGMYRVKGDPARGQDDVDAALRLLQKVGPEVAGQEGYRNSLAGIHYHRGLLAAAADMTAARKEFDAAAQLWDGLRRDFPAVPRYRARAADAQLFVGRLYWVDDRRAEAEGALRQANELYGGLAGQWKDEPEYQAGRVQSHYYLGLVLKQQARFEEAAGLFGDLVQWAPENAEYHLEYGGLCLAAAGPPYARGQVVALLPAVGLTVTPNPLGAYQGYLGQQLSAKALFETSRERYRLSVEHLGLAEKGQPALSDDDRLKAARWRFVAARGLATLANGLVDHGAMRTASDALADLAETWPSLNAPGDAGQTYRLAALYTGFAFRMVGAEGRSEDARRLVELLHRAVEKGYPETAKLRESPDVQSLLNDNAPSLAGPREDLKKLLSDVENARQP